MRATTNCQGGLGGGATSPSVTFPLVCDCNFYIALKNNDDINVTIYDENHTIRGTCNACMLLITYPKHCINSVMFHAIPLLLRAGDTVTIEDPFHVVLDTYIDYSENLLFTERKTCTYQAVNAGTNVMLLSNDVYICPCSGSGHQFTTIMVNGHMIYDLLPCIRLDLPFTVYRLKFIKPVSIVSQFNMVIMTGATFDSPEPFLLSGKVAHFTVQKYGTLHVECESFETKLFKLQSANSTSLFNGTFLHAALEDDKYAFNSLTNIIDSHLTYTVPITLQPGDYTLTYGDGDLFVAYLTPHDTPPFPSTKCVTCVTKYSTFAGCKCWYVQSIHNQEPLLPNVDYQCHPNGSAYRYIVPDVDNRASHIWSFGVQVRLTTLH